MIEDNCPRVSSSESMEATITSTAKQRKKRKWDQPAELLVTAGATVSGILPLANTGSLLGITLPSVALVSGAIANPLNASIALLPQQQGVGAVPKISQPKIQDELIAREIVINDADSAIRYKLTKRQTQEEIQKTTGAVVITRGKYRPPNAPADGEKPLYLHISAGAHLETTVERIKAVDYAAALVEDMLKQGSVSNGLKVNPLLSTCVFLGFEANQSLNIPARIRGPNDQYINHIINETGATVLLRGRGSGNSETAEDEEGQEPLHLFLSSNNPLSLEQAKVLAENLMDTICMECGATRISSRKVYAAVPPPPQLLTGVQSSGSDSMVNNVSAVSLNALVMGITPVKSVSSITAPGLRSQSLELSSSNQFQPNPGCYPQSSLTGGTSYIGYGGIYPQATPLQQVALALRQSTSPVTATVSPATTAASKGPSTNGGSSEEKHPRQKRKFQEISAAARKPADIHQIDLQDSELSKPCERMPDIGHDSTQTMGHPKKLVQPSSNGMSPPSKMMAPPPPPPPPKFDASTTKVRENNTSKKTNSENVPDTLIKLMEYGDDDDDLEEIVGEPLKRNSDAGVAPKPFWAV